MRDPRPCGSIRLALQVLPAFSRRKTPRSTRWTQTSLHFGPPFSDSKTELKSPLTLRVRMTGQQRILHSFNAINDATFVHQFLRTRLLELV